MNPSVMNPVVNVSFSESDYTQDRPVIGDSWRRWIAENKLQGQPNSELIAVLVSNGFDRADAHREVTAANQHPYLLAGRNYLQALRKLESHLEVCARNYEQLPESRAVERRERISREELQRDYLLRGRPVVLTQQARHWPAIGKWTPQFLKEEFAGVPIQVQDRRDSDALYEINVDQHRSDTTLGAYVDRVLASGETNDHYMVANNGNLARPELAPLLNDMEMFPEFLDRSQMAGKAFFWFGPQGTITPAHHDPCNLIFVQIYGRKHWRIAPPHYTHLLYNYRGVFSATDFSKPDFSRFPLLQRVKFIDVVLEPGDTLFMPVGWWHYVKSLDVSISASFTNFVFPNIYDWHYPDIQRG